MLCRGGIKQMRADADEAARRFAAEGIRAPIAALCQGLARILSGDLDGGDASFADAVIIATEVGAPEGLAEALSERSLVAMVRGEWNRADVLADQARGTLQQAGIGDSYATTLVCAVAARVALHRGDVPLSQHCQLAGDVDLSEARGRLPEPGGRAVPRAGTAGAIALRVPGSGQGGPAMPHAMRDSG